MLPTLPDPSQVPPAARPPNLWHFSDLPELSAFLAARAAAAWRQRNGLLAGGAPAKGVSAYREKLRALQSEAQTWEAAARLLAQSQIGPSAPPTERP